MQEIIYATTFSRRAVVQEFGTGIIHFSLPCNNNCKVCDPYNYG